MENLLAKYPFILDKNLNILLNIQKKYPNVYLGGSISLLLQDIDFPRVPKDLDLVTTSKELNIYDLFEEFKSIPKNPKSTTVKLNNTDWDLHYDPQAHYVEYSYKGFKLKIITIDDFIRWKKHYVKSKNCLPKHIEDLEYIMNKNYNLINE
jgi:hypothetical protein